VSGGASSVHSRSSEKPICSILVPRSASVIPHCQTWLESRWRRSWPSCQSSRRSSSRGARPRAEPPPVLLATEIDQADGLSPSHCGLVITRMTSPGRKLEHLVPVGLDHSGGRRTGGPCRPSDLVHRVRIREAASITSMPGRQRPARSRSAVIRGGARTSTALRAQRLACRLHRGELAVGSASPDSRTTDPELVNCEVDRAGLGGRRPRLRGAPPSAGAQRSEAPGRLLPCVGA
jgi:hypothetical protein